MCSGFTPIAGLTIALLISLGMCIVRTQSVRVNADCSERLLNLSTEAIIKVRNASLCARCANFFLKIKQIPFSCRLAKKFTYLKIVQNHFKILLEMSVVLASIILAERNANLSTVM